MKRFILGLLLAVSLAALPVQAQETDDRSWIENLPPNQDSIETPWFIRDTTGSTLAERMSEVEPESSGWQIGLLTISCLCMGFIGGNVFLRIVYDRVESG